MSKPCIKCKNNLPDDARFCERCGTRQPALQPCPPPSAPKKSSGTVMIVILLAVIAVAAIAVAAVLFLRGGEKKDPVVPPAAVTVPEEAPVEEKAVTDAENAPETGDSPSDGSEVTPETEPANPEPAPPSNGDDTGGTSDTLPVPNPPITVEEFNAMVEGVWVDWDSISYSGDQGVFQFCQFMDGQFCYAAYPGGISRTGTVVEVAPVENGGYNITLWYREEEYMGDYYEEEYVQMTVFVDGGELRISDDPNTTWYWTGADLEQAKEALGIL